VAEAAVEEAEKARMIVAPQTMTSQTWPPGVSGGRYFMRREEQIEQFAYLIRSGEGKQR
jgi:hypothetical protein